jgi:hypothetical protein
VRACVWSWCQVAKFDGSGLQMLSSILPRPESGVLRRPEAFVWIVMSLSEFDCGANQDAKQADLDNEMSSEIEHTVPSVWA